VSIGEWFFYGSILGLVLLITGWGESKRLRKKADYENLIKSEQGSESRKSAGRYDFLLIAGIALFTSCSIGLMVFWFF
jgi:hypothetical protein